MPNIHVKIATIRRMRDLTQEKVADASAIHLKTYQRLETGKSPVTFDQLERLTEVFECKVEDIYNFNPETGVIEQSSHFTQAQTLAKENSLLKAEVAYLRHLVDEFMNAFPDFLNKAGGGGETKNCEKNE